MIKMRLITLIGIFLILLGLVFVSAPILEQYFSFEEIPFWLVFVYKKGNFYFATSPILILLSVLSFILRIILR